MNQFPHSPSQLPLSAIRSSSVHPIKQNGLAPSPREFNEIQSLQSRLFDLISNNTSSFAAGRSTTNSETLLGSSCDEKSDNSNFDDEDDDIDQVESSSLSLHNCWKDRNCIPGSLTSTLSDCRSSRPPTIGEEDTWVTEEASSSLKPSRKDQNARNTARLFRSGSSFNCSTTASISGRSTSSSISKAVRSSLLEDGANSSKSSLGGQSGRRAEKPPDFGATPGQRLFHLLGRDVQEDDEESQVDDSPWSHSPLKTARESCAGRDARRSSLGLGPGAKMMTAPPVRIVESKNEIIGRLFRMIHKATVGRPGVLCTKTTIEVIDTSLESQPVLFSVRHSDPNLWGRQIKVHKNILLACQLTGIDVPKDIEIPIDSRKMFEQTENVQHLNTYLERIVPHIKIHNIAAGVQLYWWKAIGNGLAVLQNRLSGKLIVLKNSDKTIASAVSKICKLLNCSQLRGAEFWEPEPNYPTIEMVKTELGGAGDHEIVIDNLDYIVTQVWAVEEGVSPLQTELIVKIHPTKYLRYSIGTDAQDPRVLFIQVHLNEPLSRGMNAYLVCMVPLTTPSLIMSDVKLTFLQAVWFLRKLYDLHCDSEYSSNPSQPPEVTSTSRFNSGTQTSRTGSGISNDGTLRSSGSISTDTPRNCPKSSKERFTRSQISPSRLSSRTRTEVLDLPHSSSRVASPPRRNAGVLRQRRSIISGEAGRRRSPMAGRDDNSIARDGARTPMTTRRDGSIRFSSTARKRADGIKVSTRSNDITHPPQIVLDNVRPLFQLGGNRTPRRSNDPSCPLNRMDRCSSNSHTSNSYTSNRSASENRSGERDGLKYGGDQLSSGDNNGQRTSSGETSQPRPASRLRTTRDSSASKKQVAESLFSRTTAASASKQSSPSRTAVTGPARVGVYIRERTASKSGESRRTFAGSTTRNGRKPSIVLGQSNTSHSPINPISAKDTELDTT